MSRKLVSTPASPSGHHHAWNTTLGDMPGDPIELNAAGEPTHIRLKPFYEAVKSAWATFDTSQINPSFRRERAPKVPITTTVAMFPGASGTGVTTAPLTNVTILTTKKTSRE